MLTLAHLARKSLLNRKIAVGLTICSIGLSFGLLLGVERARKGVREGFMSSVSGVDLVVGARTGSLSLLLASVFRLGDATNNMEWETYEALAERPEARWVIPLSLGDSHRGFRVLGTNDAYYEHLRYGAKRRLELERGVWFASDNEAVIGAEVARALNYGIGQTLVVAHGAGTISFIEHDEHPFRVVGVLKPTGTPVDRTVHVDLSGISAIHADMHGQACDHAHDPLHICGQAHGGTGPAITAAFIGLKSRAAALGVARSINQGEGAALSAILPGEALRELWEVTSVMEAALRAISLLVIVVGLCGMMVALMTSLNERRREMAILRSIGARPANIFALVVGESIWISLLGVCAGFAGIYAISATLRPVAAARARVDIALSAPSAIELALGAGVILAGGLMGMLPAARAYRNALADGLTPKL